MNKLRYAVRAIKEKIIMTRKTKSGIEKVTKEEEDAFIEKIKTGGIPVPTSKKVITSEPEIILRPEFRKAVWVTHCFYVLFMGFFCILQPTERNIQSFFAWVALGFLVWLRYSVFA